MDPLSDPVEFGKRLGAARGYTLLPRTKFKEVINLSVPTIERYERGEFGEKSRADLRQIAEKYILTTGCPAYILFGPDVPSEVAAEERLSRLEKSVELMNEAQGKIQERLAELDVPDDSEQAPANAQRHAGQDREGTTK